MTNNSSIGSGNVTVTSNKKDKEMSNNNGKFPKNFKVEEFRNDIINQLPVDELKTKYKKFGFESRSKIETLICRLQQLDKKFYYYEFPEVVRGNDVYESSDGFIKISKRIVKQYKAHLGVSKINFQNVELVEGKIILTLEAA